LRVHLLRELLLGRGLHVCRGSVVERLRLRYLLADASTEMGRLMLVAVHGLLGCSHGLGLLLLVLLSGGDSSLAAVGRFEAWRRATCSISAAAWC